MRKTIIPIILGIALISLTSATTIYSGSCLEVDLSGLESLDNVVYTTVGNEFNLTGMNITLNETTKNASVCFAINFAPDSFTIIFIDNSTKEVIKEIHHYSGGGTRTKYIDRNITIENKTIEYVNVTIPCNNQTEEPTLPIEQKENLDWIYYFGGFVVLLIIFIIYKTLEKPKSNVKEKENNEK